MSTPSLFPFEPQPDETTRRDVRPDRGVAAAAEPQRPADPWAAPAAMSQAPWPAPPAPHSTPISTEPSTPVPQDSWPAPPGQYFPAAAWAPAPTGRPQPTPAAYTGPYPPYAPPSRTKRTWQILALTGGALLVTAGGTLGWAAIGSSAADRAQQAEIRDAVEKIKNDQQLPLPVDQITTWTSVRAEHDAVHFYYDVDASFDSSDVTSSAIHTSLRSRACSVSAAQEALEDGIELRLTYRFNDTDRRVTTTFDQDDCR